MTRSTIHAWRWTLVALAAFLPLLGRALEF
jgi:hypothetical protein